MIPLLLVLAGVGALALGWLVLRRLGPGARIGRILAAAPVVPVARARELAAQSRPRYVGVHGRIDADDEFEDESQRPLVFRRTRLEQWSGSGWTLLEDERRVVPFSVVAGTDAIAVDGEALDVGLVAVTRESEGAAREIPERMPIGTPPETPVRFRLEILASTDHALVLGVPTLDPVLGPIMRPGLGRPLVLTTLERDEAMRVLGAGRRGSARAASALLAGGVALLAASALWAIADAVA